MKKIKLLLAAFAAMVTMGAQAQSWTGNAPAEGTFFLYNVGAAKFLNNGDPTQEWGTNAYLQAGFGLDIKFEAASGENVFNLNTNVSNGGNSNYLATSTWCDGAATPWTFRAVDGETNVYQIINNGQYLMATENLSDVEYLGDPAGRTTSTYWKLVSEDDFKAAMQAKVYSSVDPMDVSVFIKGRSFARNDGRNSKWTTTHNDGNWVWIGASANKYYGNESWNNTFDVHQDITGLPDGTYEVRCSGFGTNGTTYIYGNSKQGQLQTDNTTAYGTNKEAKWKAIHEDNSFAGQTTGTFTLSGGNLTVGIKRETNNGGDWAIWDEFRLYYYGLDLSEFAATLAAAVQAAEAVEGTVPTAAYNALAAVVTENNRSYTSAAEYTAATNAIVNATNTAKALQADYTRYNNIKTAALAIASNTSTTAADEAVAAATTADAIVSAIATLRAAFLAELPNVSIPGDPGYIDVTAVMVDNASVSQNVDYWTTDKASGNGPTTNFGETEFYQANFKFYQTLSLTPGTWEFGVTGFHRAGNHKTYFYAGVDKILIPGVASNVVNTMAEAQTYFNNGNGKVSLKFLVESASNIEIGIDNQDTETDKWTIFRDFTLKYYGAPDYSVYTARLAELATEAAAVEGTVPTAVYTELNGVVTENNTTHANKAEYIAAIETVENAIATAKSFQSAYTEYTTIKAQVLAMKSVEGYTETTSGAASTLTSDVATVDEAVALATTTEAIADQVTALRAAGKTFLGGVRSDGEHAFDITFLIVNPSFDNNDATGWTANPAPGFQSYTNCEYYFGNTRTFDINQTLSNMPKGNYELQVQAFQRPGWFEGVYDAYNAGSNNVTSVIYINDGQATIKNLVSEGATTSEAQWQKDNDSNKDGKYYANSMRGAAAAFAAGYYWNSVLTAVEGDLKFGFKTTSESVDGDWTIFDNFRLYFYGNSINVAMDEAVAFSALADIEGANVTMARTSKIGYNTVALPFDLTEAQVKEVFGDEAEVYSFSDEGDANNTTVIFTKTATAIEANVPVLVKATKAATEIAVDDVTVKTGAAKVEGNNFDFVGNYNGQIKLAAGLWFVGDDAIYKSEGNTNMKGFRAYFQAKDAVANVKLFIDGIATSINEINGAAAKEQGTIFNIAGQRMSKLQRGVNIVGGKKVLVK